MERVLNHYNGNLVKSNEWSCNLGIGSVEEADGSVKITQRTYIEEIANIFNMSGARGPTTPLADVKALFTKSSNAPTQAPYQSAIGCLLFCARCTRPDVLFAVSLLSRFNQSPGRQHWEAVKRIIAYMNATKDRALVYRRQKTARYMVYSDADFKTQPEGDKKTSGVLILFAGAPVVYSSRRQTV